MEKNSEINNTILNENKISERKSSPIAAIAVIVAGVLLFIVAAIFKESSASSPLLFVAFCACVAGIVMLVHRRTEYKYLPTGEVLKRRTLYFEAEKKTDVETALEDGNFDKVINLSSSNSTLPLMLVLYIGTSHDVAMYQLSRYVPHCYQPLREMRFYVKQ